MDEAFWQWSKSNGTYRYYSLVKGYGTDLHGKRVMVQHLVVIILIVLVSKDEASSPPSCAVSGCTVPGKDLREAGDVAPRGQATRSKRPPWGKHVLHGGVPAGGAQALDVVHLDQLQDWGRNCCSQPQPVMDPWPPSDDE